jgi:hypothetical protein
VENEIDRSLHCISYLVISIFSLPVLQAQTRHTFTGWGAVFSSFKINKKLSIHFDAQIRSSDNWEQIQTILIRPGFTIESMLTRSQQ